jgi:DNA-cytosine methyltransferase
MKVPNLFNFMDNENLKGTPIKDLKYIDLFSGAGGFSLGFDKAGFNNIFSVEIQNDFCETYKTNFPSHTLIQNDIAKVTKEEIEKLTKLNEIDVIIGGPPCQGFSIAGNIGRKFVDDPRNKLFKEFVRIVSIVKPKYFVMENVARLYTHNQHQTKKEIIEDFNTLGYAVRCEVLNSADYGVPQIRKRVIFIGSRISDKISFPNISHTTYKTVEDALKDLPILKSGDYSSLVNHKAMNHTEQMLHKMSFIKNGGDRTDIPLNLRPKSGDVRKYIKYHSDKPSVTVTGDMRKIFHYSQNRALTVRELARLQTFPDNFEFKSSSISQQQQVGNAVPPLMAEAIANNIKNMIKEDYKSAVSLRGNTLGVKILFDNKYPKVNYIGNKEKLATWICDYFPKDANSIFDAFSGGSSIGYESKKRGYQTFSNDILKINYFLAKSLIENNEETLNDKDINIIFTGKPFKGFMYKNYSEVFFFPQECMELDLYRKNIEKLSSQYKKSIAFTLIRRAMVRKMPYSRFNLNWDKIKQLRDEEYSYAKYKRKRAYHNESFKSHFIKNLDDYNNAIFNNNKINKVYHDDVFNLLNEVNADIIYLDPPYTGTMNNYFGFYGLIDEYIQSKKLQAFKNNFIDKKSSLQLFDKLFSNLSNFKYWFLSYNNNSYPSKDELINVIGKYSDDIKVIEKPYSYKVTGKDKKCKNAEYLFIIKNTNYKENSYV